MMIHPMDLSNAEQNQRGAVFDADDMSLLEKRFATITGEEIQEVRII